MNKQPYALRLADDLRAAPERTRTSFEAAAGAAWVGCEIDW